MRSRSWMIADAHGRQWRLSADGDRTAVDAGTALATVRDLVFRSFSGWSDRRDHVAPTLIEIHNALTGQRLTLHEWVGADLTTARRISSTVCESFSWALRTGRLAVAPVSRPFAGLLESDDAPDTIATPFVGDETTFVAVRLIDQDGTPVPHAAFNLTLPDESTRTGSLGSRGELSVEGISPAGACSIVFPDFDESDFAKPVAKPGSRGPGTNDPVKAQGAGTIHVATAADTMVSISEQFGFANFETVWNAPANSGLRAKRENPQTLLEGDEVAIPDRQPATRSISTGTSKTFTVFLPRIRVRVRMLGFDGRPLAGVHATVKALAAPDDVDADDDGVFDVPVAANARELTLTSSETAHSFSIGVLGPIDSPSGIRHRLASLGYDAGDEDDATDEALRWAIEEFELDHGHKPTGTIDDGFLDRLSEAHGT